MENIKQSKHVAESGKTFRIDLSGQEANAFALLGITDNLLKQTGAGSVKREAVATAMRSADYGNLLTVMQENVGQFIYFDNVPEQYVDSLDGVKDTYGKPATYTEAGE